LIYVRTKDGIGDECFAVSVRGEQGYVWGFYSLDFANLRASYNDQTGLLLRIPANVLDNGEERFIGDIKVLINRRYATRVMIEGG
jgi:hypothetical protein